MLETLYAKGISNEYTQLMILGAVLILKRNSKDKIESLKELNNLVSDEIRQSVEYLGDNAISTINELLKSNEQDLVNEIICKPEVRTAFDVRTPENEAELMDYLLDIKDGSEIMDLYSGIGKIDEVFVKNHKNITIDGFELNDSALEIARIKMYAMKNNNVHYYKKDVLADSFDNKYQYAVADIPFISRYDKEVQKTLENDCKDLNIELSSRISTTWITAIKVLFALKENGKAVITTMKGSLFNTLDREIRKELIEKGYIEAIVDLPNKIVPYTNTEISFVVLNKSRKSKKIKFVNLKDCSLMQGKINIIDLEKAKRVIENESIEVDYKEIKENNFSLNYNTYTGNVEIENGKELGKVTWDIFRGYQITSAEINKMLVENEDDMNYKILEISNINDDGEICSELKMINSGEKNLDRYLLRDGDILISARGDKIKKCLIHIGYDERIIANGSINVIRADQNRLYPLYLKTFLDSEKGNISLNNIKSGVTIPSINVGELQKMLVPCPSMEEQRKIVDKIEVKLEIIESTAKRLEELKKELRNMANLI